MAFSLFFLFVFYFTISHTTIAVNSEYTKLVFKGCANQKFPAPSDVYTLKALLSSLVSQANQKAFFTTTESSIMGLYQCRGDLTTGDCYACVSKIPDMADDLCGKAVAARIQLSGCYLRYEVVGFKQVPETQLLYKVCGSTRASEAEFEGRRDTAFDMVENGVKNSTNGANGLFYTGSFQEVYVLGQCEGDLSVADCGDCVKSATATAKNDCGESISAQVYLHKCFVSYSYYPHGVPRISDSTGPAHQHTQRTVAIAVGGVAALGFLVVCLMFLKSVMKKKSSSKYGDY